MDSVEYEITSVIENARMFSQRKQKCYSYIPYVHSAGIPQQTHACSNTESSSENGSDSPQFNPPLLSNSRIGNTYCNTQVKNTHVNNIYCI